MVTISFRAAETGDTGQAVEAACQPREPRPGRLTPAGREAGHADASPVTLPVSDVSGMFFLMLFSVVTVFVIVLLLFLFLFFPFLSCLWLFRASPAGRAVVNGASGAVSARRASIPDAKPWLAATVPVAPPLSRRGLRSRHPGKRRRNVRSNAVSQTALHVVAAGPCSLPASATHPYESLSPGLRQPQPAALTVGVNEQPTKFLPRTR